MTPKDQVLKIYPHASCKEIESPSGSYFMIYNLEPLNEEYKNVPKNELIGYSMENEENAWKHVIEITSKNLVSTLES